MDAVIRDLTRTLSLHPNSVVIANLVLRRARSIQARRIGYLNRTVRLPPEIMAIVFRNDVHMQQLKNIMRRCRRIIQNA